MSENESLPGCLGYFEAPLPPNGPCRSCPQRELCRKVSIEFVPRKTVVEFISKIEAALKE